MNREPIDLSFEKMVTAVRESIEALRKQNVFSEGLSQVDAERLQGKKERLLAALDDCIYGSKPDKEYVKAYIRDFVMASFKLTGQHLSAVIPFDQAQHMSISDKFEILMLYYAKEHGYAALSVMIHAFRLDRLRDEGQSNGFFIVDTDIEHIYAEIDPILTFEDKLGLLVQKIYAEYKGYRTIDTLLDMSVDGISLGVSGIPESFSAHMADPTIGRLPRTYDAVWIFHSGKSIQLRFLSLGSHAELKRVCSTIFKYGHPGEISKAVGFRVNRLKDGSRCVVVRPDFAESWACFIRKFDLPDVSLEALITDTGARDIITFLTYVIKGARNTAVTGSQGSGKTTLMKALAAHIYGAYTLRVLEMAFELHIRKTQPYRNILTVRETEEISGQKGLDLLKKTDGSVTIVGEVATDPVAAYMIQTAQTASLFTLFSHHAKTFPDLVMSLRNSLLKTNVFTNERVAEEQVVRVLHFDIHMERDIEGRRFISRITECIPTCAQDASEQPIHEMSDVERTQYMTQMQLAWWQAGIGGGMYRHRDIVAFDIRSRAYRFVFKPTQNMLDEMAQAMTSTDRDAFDIFCREVFGICPMV